jgi:TPR repeat protein
VKVIELEQELVKAFDYYKKSADEGYLNAQFELGYCYFEGVGTEKILKKLFTGLMRQQQMEMKKHSII